MAGGYSKRVLCALGTFGLTTDDLRVRDAARRTGVDALASQLDARLAPGQIAMVRGASGAGKSTLLRAIASRLRSSGGAIVEAVNPGRAMARRNVIDVLAARDSQVFDALATLAAAGLADAGISARRVGELSDGERARFAIALAMKRACRSAAGGGPVTIIIDELAGTLDDATGRGVCMMLSRWVRATPCVRAVAASARDDVAGWLKSSLEIDLDEHEPRIVAHPRTSDGASQAGPIQISRGTFADYLRLASLHYRAARPATHLRILIARDEGEREPIGVLVVSMPTLNGAWRPLAWPGEYDRGCSPRERAARINRDLRCISRVIVDPRFRARGAGGALVRAYLADPLTNRTEAVAAMGAACPLFLRAGMREWTPPPARRDSRLIDAIDAAGLRPWMLADVDETLGAIAEKPFLEAALRVWARAHGPTRSLAGAPIRDLVRAAARTVIVRPRAYTAEAASS
jgi:ABC-type cobalamin/Fe3+-siderophores transport system ATPase subunit